MDEEMPEVFDELLDPMTEEAPEQDGESPADAGEETVEVEGRAIPLRDLVDAAAFGARAAEQLRALREQEQIGEIAAEHDASPETAREILAYRQERQRREQLAPYMDLLRRYPELQDPGRMPSEVADAIRQGAHPLVAYQDYLLEQRQAARQTAFQRDMARARCPGSAAGFGGGETDGALAAFDAALNG